MMKTGKRNGGGSSKRLEEKKKVGETSRFYGSFPTSRMQARKLRTTGVILAIALLYAAASVKPCRASQSQIAYHAVVSDIKSDECEWFYDKFGQADHLTSAFWDGSRFIAVGWEDPGIALVAYRSDQGVWLLQDLPYTVSLTGLANNGSTYVAVGGLGLILTSSDTVTWTPRESGTTQTLYAVTWGAGKFVAVGKHGTILTSPDGIEWTPHSAGLDADLKSIGTSGTSFMVAASCSKVLFSPDGNAWSLRDSGLPEQWAFLTSVVWVESVYVVAGLVGDVPQEVEFFRTVDGTMWQQVGSFRAGFEPTMFHGDSGFVVLGGRGVSYLSSDASQWTIIPIHAADNLTAAAFSSTNTILVGDDGNAFRWECGPLPSVSAVKRMDSPFRLKLVGDGFNEGAKVFVGVNMTPWQELQVKSPTKIVLEGGSDLKAHFPKGDWVPIYVVNPSGGSGQIAFQR